MRSSSRNDGDDHCVQCVMCKVIILTYIKIFVINVLHFEFAIVFLSNREELSDLSEMPPVFTWLPVRVISFFY